MGAAIDGFARRFGPALEAEMRAVLAPDAPESEEYYALMHYHLGWRDAALNPTRSQTGKRVRPFVCLLVCEAAGGNWETAVPAAAAIELVHNFSLIHDDIEDDSPTRRGRETVWKLWGIPQAINAGDSMFAAAFDALARLGTRGVSDRTAIEALRILTQACIHLTKGQHLDMSFEAKERVSVEQYLDMVAGKTAALLSAAAEIGAIIAETSGEQRHRFAAFGRNLGLAFQAHDDLLGIWGNESAVGKSTASDILTRKKTLPVLFGLAQSDELRRCYLQPEIDLPRVVQLLDDLGAREFVQAAAQQYSKAALAELESARSLAPIAEALETLTALLMQRES